MIRKLSSGFPKRRSLAPAQAQDQKTEIRDVRSSKKSEVQSSSKPQCAKKSLFPTNEGSKLPVATSRPTRHRSVERDVGARSGSSVQRQKRRSRSWEGRSLFTTPSSSVKHRTPVESAYHSSRRNVSSDLLSAAKTIPKDTRQLTDKHFQSQALQQVQKYIERNHMSANYLPLTLTNPMKLKTFIEVMDFLLRKPFPTIKLNQSNFAEEIPVLMKKLMYPGIVNRSWLISANTPHSWPYVLGMMQYLVSLLDCDTGLHFVEFDDDPIMDDSVSIALHNDIKEAYTQYQCYGIEDVPLSPAFTEAVCKKFDDLVGEMEVMKKEIDVMEAKLNDPVVQGRRERETVLIKQRTDLTAEEHSLREQIRAIQNERLLREKKLAELEIQKTQVGMKLQHMKDQVTTAQKMLESQSVTVAERDKILAEIARIRENCNNLDKMKEDLQNSRYTETLKINRLRCNINKAIRKYNTNLLTHADDLPVKDLEINIDHVPEEEWAQYFATFRKRLEECLNDRRGKLAQLEEMLPEIEAEGRRLDEELKRVSSQLAEEESSFKLMRTNRQKMEETLILTEKSLEKRISELEALREQVALKEAERVEITQKIKKVEKDLHYVRTEGKAFLERKKKLYRELQLHREQKEKEMISGILEELEQDREAKMPV